MIDIIFSFDIIYCFSSIHHQALMYTVHLIVFLIDKLNYYYFMMKFVHQ